MEFYNVNNNTLYNKNIGVLRKVDLSSVDTSRSVLKNHYYIVDFNIYTLDTNNNLHIDYSTSTSFIPSFFEHITSYINTFMYFEARVYNIQRINWINSLDIDFTNKNILEIGCGAVGDFTRFILHKNPTTLHSCDARQSVLNMLCERIPCMSNDVFQINAENDDEFDVLPLKHYDIIVCVGLLYHLSNPIKFLNKISSMTDCLILETMITSGADIEIVDEDASNINQSVIGIGNKMSKYYIQDTLRKLFRNVKCNKQPDSYEITSGRRYTFLAIN